MTEPITNAAEWILSGGQPDAPAVIRGEEVVSYGQLRALVAPGRLSSGAKGWPPATASASLPRTARLFVAAYLGAMRAGLCAVPLPIAESEKSLRRMVVGMDARCIVVSRPLAAKLQPAAAEAGRPSAGWDARGPAGRRSAAAGGGRSPPRPGRHHVDLGLHRRAQGRHGTHGNILANSRDIIAYMDLRPRDRAMVVLPFSYCYGISLLHTHLAAGGSLVLNNGFMFPEKVLDDLDRRQCTGLAGVPATYQILLRKTHFAARKFPSLRWLQQAGGKLPENFLRELRQALPQVKLYVMYGQTEATARLSYLPPERLDDKLGSIGRGLPHTRLEVLRDDGTPVRPGSGEVGEIVASGENITPGYWRDPDETARFFCDGKLHTGDMARVDAEGFLFLVERRRDFIKAMGNRVSPKEVEEVLAELPQVVEAAVIGVADDLWGEA